MPYKSGNVYVYDCPRSAGVDYDSPPAHYIGQKDSHFSTHGQLVDVQTDYDVPATADANSGRTGMLGALYDSPPSLLHSGQTWYDVPTCVGVDAEQASLSNRSSVLSAISNDSRSSIASLQSGSSPSVSTRSSAEVSFRDVYDIPRAASDVGRINAASETVGKISNSRVLIGTSMADRDSYLEDYSVPQNSAIVAGSSASVDVSAKSRSAATVKMLSSKEMQDFYDIPRNQQTEGSCDYDVPAESHSASQTYLNKTTSASETGQRSDAVGQSDVFHRQIVAKHDAILRSIERLTDLAKKEVRGDVKHWCSLVTTTGLSLRTALKELLDLSRMPDSNSDSVVATRLNQQCEPLIVIHASVSQCLETSLAASPKANEARCFGTEDLTNLTELVNRLHPLVNEFCVFLHSNAADICRLTVSRKSSTGSASPVVGRRQAPAVKAKPVVTQRISDVQLRPLPMPPSSSQPSTQPAAGKENTTWMYDDYDYISISREAESNSAEQADRLQPALESLQRSASTHPPPTDPSKRCAVINGVVNDQPVVLSAADCDLITYYLAQVRLQTSAVESAVGEFCQSTTSDAVTPDMFVQRSKQVVVAGHRVVYIGDAVARHVTDNDVCNRVASAANVLCDCLKSVVVFTKEAVLSAGSSNTLHTRATDSAKSALTACKQLCELMESYTGQP